MVDAVTFNGVLGIEATSDHGFSVGLDYMLKASENMLSHIINGLLSIKF